MASLPARPHTAFAPLSSATRPSLAKDILVLLAVAAVLYGLLSLAKYWAGPVDPHPEIYLRPSILPLYALYSVARLTCAYLLSLAVTLLYGYFAAHNARAEKILIPLLDTLQSIPVLSFLPPVMLAMVTLFPSRQLGLELGSILLIATGQMWNMIFSFYSSIKAVPREMAEAAQVYRMSWFQRLVQIELPSSAIGLIWNSMMSVAGGWFFLMACEMFVLGNRDLRLPGLGAYLQTAASAGDTPAILWGLFTMIAVIVLTDQLIWRPLIAWSTKFKLEQVEAAQTPRSPVLNFLRHSRVLLYARKSVSTPLFEAITRRFSHKKSAPEQAADHRSHLLAPVLLVAMGAGVAWGVFRMSVSVAGISGPEFRGILVGAGATFLRVELALVLAALWTIPAGVAIGLRPRLASFAQPLAQIAASVPATALFPIVLLALIHAGGGLGAGSIILLLLGTQWYLLFNVIAGASAIPTDLKEVCALYQFTPLQRWRTLILPAIFPALITGLVTASGGAWNASIVAEYFRVQGKTISTTGLGATISRATDSGNFPVLIAATLAMSLIVVTVNRVLWRRLYQLASGRFSMNA